MAIENLTFEIYFRFSRIQTYIIFYFLRILLAKQFPSIIEVPGVGFSAAIAGVDHTKFGFYQFQRFLFIVLIVISI